MTEKIVAFCGEAFFKSESNENTYVAKPTSAAFLQDAFGHNNIYVVSPFRDEVLSGAASTVVDESFFYKVPYYSSTKDFFVKLLFKPNFYREFVSFCDEIISVHKGGYFWVRTPSIGSIVFGLRVLKHDQTLLHHMCADASNTWKDAKYKGIDKLLAFATSKLIRLLLKKICSHPNTTNLCTGDVLESFSKQFSGKTYQFVDVMIKNVDTSEIVLEERKDNRKKLLFVGRMVDDKGIFDLIEVVSRLKQYYTLTLVGDGPDLAAAKQMVDQLELKNTIEFTGQLPHSSLSELFYGCDLVAVPSNNNYEGFPRVIMEAWSFYKPVVVSNVGGINAFVKDGENGLIIQPGNKADLKKALMKCNDKKVFDKITQGANLMAKMSTQNYWIESLVNNVKVDSGAS